MMDEDIARVGRDLTMMAYGDSAPEIEMAALDAARKVFGDDVRLVPVRKYSVTVAGQGEANPAGKKYRASITVRVMD